jgi:hypothetical protein
MREPRNHRGWAFAALLAATWLMVGRAAAEPVRCQRAIAKESAKHVQTVVKALQKCEDRKAAGSVAASTDCTTETRTVSLVLGAETRLRQRVAQRCGGSDSVCGTPGDDSLASIGWGSVTSCPGFEGGSCTNPISDCDDIATCLACVGQAAVRQAIDLYYGALDEGQFGNGSTINRCQRAIGKETSRFFAATTKALQRCWDARLKGRHTNPCPAPGDGKAVAKIAKAEARKVLRICSACGGGDGCGGSGDVTPAQVGFVSTCPDVTVPNGGQACAAPIGAMQDIVDCVDCVSEFKADCADAVAVPGLTAYPPECQATTTSTTTTVPTSTTIITLPTTTLPTIIPTTTTTTTSTTSTTVSPCAPTVPVPVGSVTVTIEAGSPDCGGPGLVPSPQPPFAGQVNNIDSTKRADLGLGCLYFGGSGALAFPPAQIPDGGESVLDVAGIQLPLSLTLQASAGNGPADCTLGAGPDMRCANGGLGTDGMGLCTSSTDCGGAGTCLPEPNCYFGPPIPVPAGATSVCIVNAIASDACGVADLSANTTTAYVNLSSRIYLTSDNASPCPRCVASICTAGKRAGMACTGGVGSKGTTIECPPSDGQFTGALAVALAPVSTGSSSLNHPIGDFCPDQRSPGAFGGEASAVIVSGSPLGGGPGLFSSTLAGVFCLPSTGVPLIDAVGDLPGPGAVSVPTTLSVNLL